MACWASSHGGDAFLNGVRGLQLAAMEGDRRRTGGKADDVTEKRAGGGAAGCGWEERIK